MLRETLARATEILGRRTMRIKMLYVKIMVLRAKTTFVDNGRDLCIGEQGDRARIHQYVRTEEADTL
jgi:hypothetical protein